VLRGLFSSGFLLLLLRLLSGRLFFSFCLFLSGCRFGRGFLSFGFSLLGFLGVSLCFFTSGFIRAAFIFGAGVAQAELREQVCVYIPKFGGCFGAAVGCGVAVIVIDSGAT